MKLALQNGNSMKNIFFLVLILSACSAQNVHFSNISDIVILESGQDDEKASKLCGMFNLNASEAHEYFKRSTRISENEAHHLYDYYSCWVKGEFKKNGQTCQWYIDIGGLADVNCEGAEYKLYCKGCENFLLDQIP